MNVDEDYVDLVSAYVSEPSPVLTPAISPEKYPSRGGASKAEEDRGMVVSIPCTRYIYQRLSYHTQN